MTAALALKQQESVDRKERLSGLPRCALMSLNCSVNGYSRITKPTSAPVLQTQSNLLMVVKAPKEKQPACCTLHEQSN